VGARVGHGWADVSLIGHEPPSPYELSTGPRTAEHLSVPLRRDGSRLATVPQDSPEEVEQCVAAILRTQPGHRDDLPEFGTPDQAFQRGGVDLDVVVQAVEDWEDRAPVELMREDGSLQALAEGVDRVTVDVEG
jgi:phage baseplate assembly protein W